MKPGFFQNADSENSMGRLIAFMSMVQAMVVTNFGIVYLALAFFIKGQSVIDGMVIISSGLALVGGSIGLKGWQSKLENDRKKTAATVPVGQ